MTDLQGALGVEQVKRLPQFLAERRRQAEFYDRAFSRLGDVQTPGVPVGSRHAFQSYLVRLRGSLGRRRDQVIRRLVAAGVACRCGIAPLHRLPFFRAQTPDLRLPAAEAVAHDSLFLPIFPGLSRNQQVRVVETLAGLTTKGQQPETVMFASEQLTASYSRDD